MQRAVLADDDVKERRKCEFFLVRYVPDPVKGEFVNIGVILREADAGGQTGVRVTRDWRRVRCIDPDADIALLEGLEESIRWRLTERGEEGKPILQELEDTASTSVQLSRAQGRLTENLTVGLEELMKLYVESRKREKIGRRSGRQAIYLSMRSHFERAGVWDLMQKRIAVAKYTRAGDPLRIDCGYRPNGVIRMFHAVSLESDLDLAKVLAFSVDRIREGVSRVENAGLELTAVVEPLRKNGDVERDPEQTDEYAFAKETMEGRGIRVLTTKTLPQIAETARRELRL